MAEVKIILSVDKYKGSTYCVEFEDGDKIYLNSTIIAKFSLRAEVGIPQEALDEIIFENDFRRAKERAFYLIDFRDHSYKELLDKLEKNYTEDVCSAVMAKMVELRLIDDRKYAEMVARNLVEVKHFGKYRASFEMYKKGLDKELIAEMLEPYEEETQERLDTLVAKKYARYLVDQKGVQKVRNALTRQGYSYADIKAVLENYLDEVED